MSPNWTPLAIRRNFLKWIHNVDSMWHIATCRYLSLTLKWFTTYHSRYPHIQMPSRSYDRKLRFVTLQGKLPCQILLIKIAKFIMWTSMIRDFVHLTSSLLKEPGELQTIWTWNLNLDQFNYCICMMESFHWHWEPIEKANFSIANWIKKVSLFRNLPERSPEILSSRDPLYPLTAQGCCSWKNMDFKVF